VTPEPPIKELTDGDVVTFVATKNYGRAEFAFCPVWKRRKLDALYIYQDRYRRFPRKQQDNAECSYVVRSGYSDGLAVLSSWTHRGVEEPRAWLYWWCREHKCMSFNCYAPANSDRFTVHLGSTMGIYFELRKP